MIRPRELHDLRDGRKAGHGDDGLASVLFVQPIQEAYGLVMHWQPLHHDPRITGRVSEERHPTFGSGQELPSACPHRHSCETE